MSQKPVVLIIHGAWHVPAHYRTFVELLRDRGYEVLVPALLTCGLGDDVNGKTYLDDAAVVRQTLIPHLEQGRRAIILAHSYGGIVATEAMQGLESAGGVLGLVYLAAYIGYLPSWKQIIDPDPLNPVHRIPLSRERGETELYYDVEPEIRDEAISLLVALSTSAADPPSSFMASAIGVPKTYVICTEDRILPPATQREYAEGSGSDAVELNCGHCPFLIPKQAENLADIIEKHARE